MHMHIPHVRNGRVAAVVVVCAGFLFFRAEQGAVARTMRSAQHVSDSNVALKVGADRCGMGVG
jgi:hypothetical protein